MRKRLTQNADLIYLIGLWLAAFLVDRLWFFLDQSVPAWDQGDHLARAMHYWRLLQSPHLLSEDWWAEFWQLSPTYRGPLIYLLTTPFLALAGAGFGQAALVNSLFTGILLPAVYALGRHCWHRQVGLWGAGLCLLSLIMVRHRTDYLLDYGIMTLVMLALTALTFWRDAPTAARNGWPTFALGLTGAAIGLASPRSVVFLLLPGLWVLGEHLRRKAWGKLGQFILALGLAWLLIAPWWNTNWLTILSSMLQANAGGSRYEGDPAATTLAGWLWYPWKLPFMLSWPLFLLPLGCWLLVACQTGWGNGKDDRLRNAAPTMEADRSPTGSRWGWLGMFLLGGYVICTLASNKDERFFMPCLPVILLFQARGLLGLGGRSGELVRVTVVILALYVALIDLFPLPGAARWGGSRLYYSGPTFPHRQVIETVIDRQPYLRSTVGLVVNTAEVNPMNIDFYGAIARFQVYGRQLAFSEKTAFQDSRSVDWFLTKTGAQGNYISIEAGHAALRHQVETSRDLEIVQTWPMPDQSVLHLYHRRRPTFEVKPEAVTIPEGVSVQLQAVDLPSHTPAGVPVRITYQLTGKWADLTNGLLLLSWQNSQGQGVWFHDHGIALGQLYAPYRATADQSFQVVEHLAMRPPQGTLPGVYTLRGDYLHRQTGDRSPLVMPLVQIKIDPQAPPDNTPPELDWVTQFLALAQPLRRGQLDPVFAEISRINQYDPLQDYLHQTKTLLKVRLSEQTEQIDQQIDHWYALALIAVLQRRPLDAIACFERLTQLERQNPWPWAYLGFVRLYRWQPRLAQQALEQAERLSPNLPEVRTLRGVAAALQFNIPQALQLLRS